MKKSEAAAVLDELLEAQRWVVEAEWKIDRARSARDALALDGARRSAVQKRDCVRGLLIQRLIAVAGGEEDIEKPNIPRLLGEPMEGEEE